MDVGMTGVRRSAETAASWASLLLAATLLGGCHAPAPGGQQDAGIATGPSVVQPQRDWSDEVVYFVLLDRFADGDPANNLDHQPRNPGGWHGGDLRGLREQLDEIASLGATAIWINPVQRQIDAGLPVNPIPEAGVRDWFEHWGFHGYWIDDFYALEPRFGDEEELKELVAAAHARGIKVLLDVVYNHSGYGAKYETDARYAGWIRNEKPDCETDPLRCRVGGLPDFVTENPEVAEYVLQANIGLAQRTGLDGFRLDTVKHIDHEFWQLHRERTRAELGEDFFLLGEVWGGSAQVLDPWFAGDELDAGFDFTFRGSCRDFMAGRMRGVAYSAYLDRRHRVRDGYHLAHYLSSHDEPLQLHEMGGDRDRFRLCVALQMTTLGIPVIFYGEEVGREGSVWPKNREDMPWGERDIKPGRGIERDEGMREWYRALIAARRQHPALSRGTYTALHAEGDLLVFRKDDPGGDDAAIVVINRGAAPATIEVPAPQGWSSAVDRLSGEAASITQGQLGVSAPGLGARIYVPGPGER
jgi:glycosidase